ncbi:MAG: hypothetical protein COX81_02410 [Candidatus Magasanikbacteria bacterium CG_4_10_14_0_2_um_filter_37_12]|uniref:Uncharacterized protein n=1 Tax=Candidatus Magasanikbacteria bacterium CG_4_10_14_0_2_um_filter_37_12 TaxID=1974637 RepID=A0A2M7V7Z2_9BACT|nr:MAG: hypothetical protein COX81_02410 [Candidatus Magasanikbacteria bacterium CG_4_10_14_0_2_um_filter_37_12]
MDDISQILKKAQPKKETNKKIHSELHYWTDIISSAFGEKKKFGMYLGIIKRIGITRARQIFAEIQDSGCESPGKLFVWKSKQTNFKAK